MASSSSSTGADASTACAGSLDSIVLMAAERSSSSSLTAASWIAFATGRPAIVRDSSATGASGSSTTLYEYLFAPGTLGLYAGAGLYTTGAGLYTTGAGLYTIG